jgi:hypothetical protein
MRIRHVRSNALSRGSFAFFAVAAWLLVSCAGSETGAGPRAPLQVTEEQLDGDPLLLLPPGPILALTFDARAFYEGRSFGADLGLVAEKLLPLATEAGFSPSRDVDRVVVGSYAMQGADVVAVVRGRFDGAQMVRAAAGALVSTPYADRQMYTVSTFGFTVLTPHTFLMGTAAGLRRALDRIHDGRVKMDLPPWAIEALETKGAAFAFAGDFGGAPLSGLQGLPLPPWVGGVKTIRGFGDFHDPGVNVQGTVAFNDPPHASAGADAMRQLGALINTVAIAGVVPQLKNLTIDADGPNVRCAFAVDEAPVHALLKQLPQWIGKAH